MNIHLMNRQKNGQTDIHRQVDKKDGHAHLSVSSACTTAWYTGSSCCMCDLSAMARGKYLATSSHMNSVEQMQSVAASYNFWGISNSCYERRRGGRLIMCKLSAVCSMLQRPGNM